MQVISHKVVLLKWISQREATVAHVSSMSSKCIEPDGEDPTYLVKTFIFGPYFP